MGAGGVQEVIAVGLGLDWYQQRWGEQHVGDAVMNQRQDPQGHGVGWPGQ